jgi:hypothetical protein
MKREEIVRRIVAILGLDSRKDVEATLDDMETYEWEQQAIVEQYPPARLTQ